MKCEFEYEELSMLSRMVSEYLEIEVKNEKASITSDWFRNRYALLQKIIAYYDGEEEDYPETY